MVVPGAPGSAAAVGPGAGGGQWRGPLHGAARLLEGQAAGGLGRGVVQVVQEVVGGAVGGALGVAVLGAARLLGGGGLGAAGVVGVAQGQVGRVLLAAGGQPGHGSPPAPLPHAAGQTAPTVT